MIRTTLACIGGAALVLLLVYIAFYVFGTFLLCDAFRPGDPFVHCLTHGPN